MKNYDIVDAEVNRFFAEVYSDDNLSPISDGFKKIGGSAHKVDVLATAWRSCVPKILERWAAGFGGHYDVVVKQARFGKDRVTVRISKYFDPAKMERERRWATSMESANLLYQGCDGGKW